jgi:predicted amidohydrolase YtcJ
MFLADPVDLGRTRCIAPGAKADLCLLARPWRKAREALSADLARTTIIGGRVVFGLSFPDASRCAEG